MPLLFSYGTLQQQNVQLSTFGRLLRGEPDQLVGFEQSQIVIDDPQVVATSGKSRHTIVKFNGRDDSRVSGTVFEITAPSWPAPTVTKSRRTSGLRRRWHLESAPGCTWMRASPDDL